VAAILCGPWLLTSLLRGENKSDQAAKIGIALPPGPSFVGGTNLVLWRHARYECECIELIRELVSPQAQIEFCPPSGLLPVRMETLADPIYTTDPHARVLVEALHKGRVPTPFPLWGMVEDKLTISFAQIWSDIYTRPRDSLEAILARHLESLSRRMDIMLGG
jgi:multiple sugar transport system substrate-binding protein